MNNKEFTEIAEQVDKYYEHEADYEKVIGLEKLRWGSPMLVLWKEEERFAKEEGFDPWENADNAILIGLPGFHGRPEEVGVVWAPNIPGIKDSGDPAWAGFTALLSFKELSKIKVLDSPYE